MSNDKQTQGDGAVQCSDLLSHWSVSAIEPTKDGVRLRGWDRELSGIGALHMAAGLLQAAIECLAAEESESTCRPRSSAPHDALAGNRSGSCAAEPATIQPEK